MGSEYNFCTRCGAELPVGCDYCPECGKCFVEGTDRMVVNVSRNPLMFFIVLIALYALFSIVEGLYVILFNDLFISNIEAIYGTDLETYLARIGVDSAVQFSDILHKEGIVNIVSGSFAVGAFILCLRMRYWKLACVFCLLATFSIPVSLIFMPFKMIQSEGITIALQVLVGLMVTRGIVRCKMFFR